MSFKKYTHQDKELIASLINKGLSDTQIHRQTGIPRSSIYDLRRSFGYSVAQDPDAEVIETNVKLAFQKQKLQDVQRVERKSFREFARVNNVIEEMNEQILKLLTEQRGELSSKIKVHKDVKEASGFSVVAHLSDLHAGELIMGNDVLDNRFDTEIFAKRLKKYANRVKMIAKAHNVKSITILCGGDFVGNNNRLSEITAYAGARTNVVMNAYLILRDMILDLNQDFKISIAAVSGNESRLAEGFDSSNFLASNNFDMMIFHMLRHSLESDSIKFLNGNPNPIEQVVNVAGVNFLLVHGNLHKKLAATASIESETEKLKAKYAAIGCKIGYVVCGHYHSSMLGTSASRSASLSGGNSYSDRTLNFNSQAAQNIYIVNPDKTVDPLMVNLHYTDEITDGYYYDPSLVSYFADDIKPNVIIQSVLV